MATNKNTLTKYVLALVTVWAVFSPAAAENWHPVHHLSAAGGLPTDGVRQVYLDRDGYVWIATTDGLCRYDGHQLKVYKTNLYTPNLLTGNKINTVAEDDNHNLWIGTTSGLNVLNKVTGKITQIDADRLGNNYIQAILSTKKNGLWIGTAKGLHRYIPEKDTFIYYDNAVTGGLLKGNDVKTMIEDRAGNIWIGAWNGGLTRLDPAKGIFYPYPVINPENSVHVIFEDSHRNLWVGSWGYGLFRVENPEDPEKARYVNYSYSPNDAGSLSDNIIYALSQDLNTNTLWVGTRSGLSILNDVNNPSSFTNYMPNRSSRQLIYNEVNSIIRDSAGLMWIGTLGGGVSVINTQETLFNLNILDKIKYPRSSSSIRSIYIDRDGINWLGIGSYGLASFNPAKNEYTFYENHPDFRSHPITSTVNAIIQFGNTASYAFATYGQGLFIYRPELSANKILNIRESTHEWLKSDIVFSIREDAARRLWIGDANGISVYDPETGKGVACPCPEQIDSVDHCSVLCIEEDAERNIWLATESDGAFKVTGDADSSLHFTRYYTGNGKLNSNSVQYIYKDSRERLWLGCEDGGLNLYDKNLDAFVSVQQKYGIPGDVVYNIIEDDRGNLWMGTNAGLIVLKFPETPSDEKVICRYYTVSDGLQDNSFNRNAVFKTRDGKIYFGGHKGYNSFYPADLYESNQVFPLVITDIKISNHSLETLDEALRTAISPDMPGYTDRICLPYSYNNFSIEFATLSYSNSMQNKYAYRLIGFDKEWQHTDASKRFASYSGLKSGVYYFQLKSSSENGVWNEMETPLKVVVLPPPWLTWQAYLIYLTVAAAILYIGAIVIRKSKEKAARELKKQFVFEARSMNYTSMEETFLKQAIECVNQHIDDPDFNQQQFADALCVGKSTLYKKLKSLTDLNTSAFIRKIRLETARKIMEENRKIRISELAYAVGFSDPKYFSSCFKKEFGLIPSEYMDKISKKKDSSGGC